MTRILSAASWLMIATTIPVAAAADQSLLDLPAVVKTTIVREAGGRSIAGLDCTTYNGHPAYRVRIEQEGIDKRVTIISDGSVVDITDFPAVNNAIASSKQAGTEAWSTTKDVAAKTWEASKETVRRAIDAFRSDDLTLNQVPAAPRATLERTAAGNRITDIHATSDAHGTAYHAIIRTPDGHAQSIVVRDDGAIEPATP